MSANKKLVSVANIHTPEELLANAEYLYSLNTPKATRAAVLESIVALESFVEEVVFTSLQTKMDPSPVQWLKDRTRMDFDSRLSVFTPIATGLSVDKQAPLWNRYKKAKTTRNKVSHSGVPVSVGEARFVIDTVYAWLAYLGSTAELEGALLELKAYIEERSIPVHSEKDAVDLTASFFEQTKAATTYVALAEAGTDLDKIPRRADLILKFGSYLVLVETKFSSEPYSVSRLLSAVKQVSGLGRLTWGSEESDTLGTVVLLQKGKTEPGVPVVQRHGDGKILSIVIEVSD